MKVTCSQAVEPPQTGGLKRRRRGLLSPSSSTDSLHENITHACAAVIQRKWRALQRQRTGQSPLCHTQAQGAQLHGDGGECLSGGAAAPDGPTPPPSVATATWVTTVAGLLVGGLSADAALALESGPEEDLGPLFEQNVDEVATAEAAAAAEAGLSARRGASLKRIVFAALLRWALVRLSDVDHLDALLTSSLGPFAAAFTVGTMCGAVARTVAATLVPPKAPTASKQRRLPQLTRAFGLGALQTSTISAASTVAHGLHATGATGDAAVILGGALAGALAASASKPLDESMLSLRKAVRRSTSDQRIAAALFVTLDFSAFVLLESAFAKLGLDPVTPS